MPCFSRGSSSRFVSTIVLSRTVPRPAATGKAASPAVCVDNSVHIVLMACGLISYSAVSYRAFANLISCFREPAIVLSRTAQAVSNIVLSRTRMA